VAPRFSAADLAFACLASPAVLPAQYSAWLPPLEAFPEDARARASTLRDTPAGAFVMRLFREERGRVVVQDKQPVDASVAGQHGSTAAT
jgi:glutathione S-transferase